MRALIPYGWLICGMVAWESLDGAAAAERPNIVFVLFDDLGYGQPPSYRSESEFSTPNLDRLASEGMRFRDAHSASAVCTPTRYGVLTGRYPMRIGQYGVLTTYSGPIIPSSRTTVASLLRRNGYHTACIGKWHLGLLWEEGRPGAQNRVPVGSRLASGPGDLGFDYFCGFTHARNIGTVIEQDAVIANVEAVENQPLLLDKAVQYLEGRAEAGGPFFLYLPVCPPHTPIVPAEAYRGRGGVPGNEAEYGDWVYQGDAILGEVLETLERLGLADETLVMAASDNGAEGRSYPPLRGSKRSVYEGGHRVPFAVRWPGVVRPGSVCEETVCLNDLLATCAAIVDEALPDDVGEDSFSLLDAFTERGPVRKSTVHQSHRGDLAIRAGDWKLILFRDGRRELYDLANDLQETVDLFDERQEVATRLSDQLQQIVERGRSTPGVAQENEAGISL